MRRKDGLEGKSDEEIISIVLVTLGECGIEVSLVPGEFNFTPLSLEDYQDDPDLICAMVLPPELGVNIPRINLESTIKREVQRWLDDSVNKMCEEILKGIQTEEPVGLFGG